MALITRFSRLLRADAHAVLDQIEDPQAVLRQSVRDMQAEVLAGAQRIVLLQQDITRLQRQLSNAGHTDERYSGQVDDALEAGRDDLARSVIRQRLQQQQLVARLDAQLARSTEGLDSAKSVHHSQQAELENMQQKLSILGTVETTTGDAASPDAGVTDEQVELELVREKNQRSAA